MKKFTDEGEEFRTYMADHPNAVVLQREADGSCIVGSDGDTIDVVDYAVVENVAQEPQTE